MSTFPNAYDLSAADDARLRRLARRHGLAVQRTRWRYDSIDNFGGYRLIDVHHNAVVDGSRFDLTGAHAAESILAIAEPAKASSA